MFIKIIRVFLPTLMIVIELFMIISLFVGAVRLIGQGADVFSKLKNVPNNFFCAANC